MMQISILGSGSVYGAPVLGCNCSACTRARSLKQYIRAETSALLEEDGYKILIDAGIANLEGYFEGSNLETILLTHYHVDHVMGLFRLRWSKDRTISVIGPDDPEGCADLFKHSGVLDFGRKAEAFKPIELGPFLITPLPLLHSKLTYGYFIESVYDASGSIAYLTDTVGLPSEVSTFLQSKKVDLAIIDASEPPAEQPPRNHNDLSMALDIHDTINPRKSVLTHIGHELDVWFERNPSRLPNNVFVAADGDTYEVASRLNDSNFDRAFSNQISQPIETTR